MTPSGIEPANFQYGIKYYNYYKYYNKNKIIKYYSSVVNVYEVC